MNPRQLIPALAALACLAWVLTGERRSASPEEVSVNEGVSTTASSPSSEPPPPVPDPAEIAATHARIEELKKQEDYLQTRARALESKPRESRVIQDAYAARWRAFLATNQALHEHQRAQAKAHPKEPVTCGICAGSHLVNYCVICEDKPGKCPTCFGAGTGVNLGPCAACEGTGKCPMCGGSSRMLCPYCDDGIVDLTLAPPRNDFKLP